MTSCKFQFMHLVHIIGKLLSISKYYFLFTNLVNVHVNALNVENWNPKIGVRDAKHL